ncbi:MAG: hypothetical protein GY810_04430 [Aureispira sp.]|nr:hypothetical protein [Aureispira sp.]
MLMRGDLMQDNIRYESILISSLDATETYGATTDSTGKVAFMVPNIYEMDCPQIFVDWVKERE